MYDGITDFDKLLNIGKVLGLSKQESKVFAYKVLGLTNTDIQEEMDISRDHCGRCAINIQKKLNITDEKSKNAKNYTLEVLADEFLKYYDDIVRPLAEHNTYELIQNIKKIDEQLGR